MVQITLDTLSRVRLHYLLAALQGNLADVKIFDEITRAIALKDDQRAAINLAETSDSLGNMRATWNPTAPELMQTAAVELETGHAKRLLEVMTNYQGLRRGDLGWAGEVVGQLKQVT